jgi:gas vesicle protein
MSRSTLTIGFYLLLVFVGGVAVGGVGHRLYTVKDVSATTKRKTPEQYRHDYMAEMKQRLHLTDTQASNVEKVLDATRDRYRQFRDRTKPEMDKIQLDQTTGIRGILNDEQMAEYDKMRSERETKRKQGFGGGM